MADPIATVEQNVSTIHRHRVRADLNRSRLQTVVDNVASFLGSTRSLMAHIAFYVAAIIICFTGLRRDLAFAWLETLATLEALFLAVFVLINQRRMSALDRRHADLDLQISLLTEKNLSQVARALAMIGEKLEINDACIRDLKSIKRAVDPDEILEQISEKEDSRTRDVEI